MFEPDLEAMPVAERRALQEQRLGDLLERLRSSGSEYWREKLRGVRRVREPPVHDQVRVT